MLIESLLGYLAPKITQYLFSNLKAWAEPVAKGVGCHVINYAGESYATYRADIEQWVRNIIPGERFDDRAVKVVDKIIVFAMQEIADFIECEIKLHGLNAIAAIERAEECGQVPSIFESISNKVTTDIRAAIKDID